MTRQEFVQQLDARIAKYDLLCHPFYQAWAAGTLSREDLREYAREYFHHVEAFPSYLDEFAARLPHSHMRRAVLANREEEAGGDGSRPHSELCVYHSRVWQSQLERIVENNSAAEERALAAAERSAKALWKALDGIEAARASRAA